jgi:FKBP-type peptidyl-prolyl cis-trans isomerase FklB
LNRSQFIAGFISAAQDKPLVISIEDAQMYVQVKSTELHERVNESGRAENEIFLAENMKKEGVVTLPSGLQYKVESEGTGSKPTAADVVQVNYKGTDIYGKVFDSNDSITFSLSGVIPGWTEGIQLMSVGSKYKLYIPYDLAYGERGMRPNIAPFATLIFDVELLDIVKK